MKIRQALVTDLFELSRLWSYMVKEQDANLIPDLEMWRNYIVSLMRYNGYFMFVAESNDKILGFIDYSLQPEPGKGIIHAVINYFYVLPEFRLIVSGDLWKTSIESAKKNGAKEFFSFCYENNIDFWEKHGFRKECYTIRRVI